MEPIYIALSGSTFTEKEVPGFGLKISSPFGHISVLTGGKFSPAKHSVTEFIIDEKYRGQGRGDELVREVVRRYRKDIGAQCSSAASVALFYKHGFRMPDQPNHKLHDALLALEAYSSVYLKLN